jgi:hypothetical protein
MGLFGKRPRPSEARTEAEVHFLSEQDGPPERQLKELLVHDLGSCKAERAYLVRVQYRDPKANEVALCVRGPDDPSLVRKVGVRFAALFGREAHLDIIFVNDAQEEQLKQVCKPFYGAA